MVTDTEGKFFFLKKIPLVSVVLEKAAEIT
jgi:hypothetical protein